MNIVFGRKVLHKKIMFRLRNWMTTSYLRPLSTECEKSDHPRELSDIVKVSERMTLKVEELFTNAQTNISMFVHDSKNVVDTVQDDKRTRHHSCSPVI